MRPPGRNLGEHRSEVLTILPRKNICVGAIEYARCFVLFCFLIGRDCRERLRSNIQKRCLLKKRLTCSLHLLSGVAKKKSQDSILGNSSSSYALQVLEGTTARIENTKHKIQIKRKAKGLKGSSFGVLLDLNNQFLNIYLDGELQTDINRPKGPTFKGLSGEMSAGLCLYGSKVEMSMVTGIATPLAPGISPVNYIWTERVPCS